MKFNTRRSKVKQKKKRYRWIKLTGTLFLLLLLGVGIYVYNIYSNAKEAVNNRMNSNISSIDSEETKKKLAANEKINILLLGIDKRENDKGRSDAMIVLTLDPKNDKMQLISIPRDTHTYIVGMNIEDKINHAYAFGGSDMSVATVENMLDIDIDGFVEINMEGLSDLVDSVGGITVYNNTDWYDENGFHYSEGELHLNGKQALGYVRMRKLDSDFARTERQREVIQAIIKKGTNFANITKINEIINVLGNNVKTNITFNEMQNLVSNYSNVLKNTESYMVQGEGKMVDKTWYYFVSEEELEKVNEMIVNN
ncbi:LCP family protein [Caldibacillus thermolactis]|uniref:LCP family protein n=1 Tax=Pallidibacillus thermolactis TaxID=251051 RepID=A0ABT2WFW1_9BACI|nr:LCP family protein [Pallidibacillus thermolactis]MCU9594577.1 LCP family protein [Pallidibacillus thermolactis]